MLSIPVFKNTVKMSQMMLKDLLSSSAAGIIARCQAEDYLSDFTLRPRICAAQHTPAPVQINCYLDVLPDVQRSSDEDHYNCKHHIQV